MSKRRVIVLLIQSLLGVTILSSLFMNCSPFIEASRGGVSDLSGSSRAKCRSLTGLSGSPKTILEATDLIDSLPKPTSISCFIQSLDRPLKLVATTGNFSAQPAAGTENPRIFIFSDRLLISVVPVGIGKNLVEFGQLLSDQVSIKGEIEFPILEKLDRAAAFTRINEGQKTVCAGCHRQETKVAEIDFTDAFASHALRPTDWTLMQLSSVQSLARTCDRTKDADRCDLLDAVFGFGPVQHQAFPDAMDTSF